MGVSEEDRRLARIIAKELAVREELRQPMKKWRSEIVNPKPIIKQKEQIRLNKLKDTKVDKREGQS